MCVWLVRVFGCVCLRVFALVIRWGLLRGCMGCVTLWRSAHSAPSHRQWLHRRVGMAVSAQSDPPPPITHLSHLPTLQAALSSKYITALVPVVLAAEVSLFNSYPIAQVSVMVDCFSEPTEVMKPPWLTFVAVTATLVRCQWGQGRGEGRFSPYAWRCG